MLGRFGLIVLAALFVTRCCARPVDGEGYVESGNCEEKSGCTYKFVSEQQFSQGGLPQNFTVSSLVDVNCFSVGTFDGNEATEYCLKVRNLVISGSALPNLEKNEETQTLIDDMLAGQFCFVQTVDGKVVAVYHDSAGNEAGLNLKKSIAAAFQANFRNQEEEEEEDPQSRHTSHYSFQPTDEEGSVKMHRTVTDKDVKEYSTGARVKDVLLEREEDIEYRSGTLQHSAGTASIKMFQSHQPRIKENSTISDMYSLNGSYSLDLMRCYRSPSMNRGKRSTKDGAKMTKDSLMATVDRSSAAKAEMQDLRNSMPSIPQVLLDLKSDPGNTKLSDRLERLLILESEYGPLSGYAPVLNDVIDFLTETMENPMEPGSDRVIGLIFSMLSAESSYKSQMILLEALKHAPSEKERISIISYIAFIHDVHPDLLTNLEQCISSADNYLDPLLLAYGSLADKASPENEERIVNFLLDTLASSQHNDPILIHLIYALGNTGSEIVLDTLFSFSNHSNVEVQLVTISAMKKLTGIEQVQEMFISILQRRPAIFEYTLAVTEALSMGYDYLEIRSIDFIPLPRLLSALVASALDVEDLELEQLVLAYLRKFGSMELARDLQHSILTEEEVGDVENRGRRGTDWDAHNSDYDIVASQGSRASDVQNYPNHKAYIWGKTIGNSDANLKIGTGLFMGRHQYCPNFKAFGKAAATAKVLRWSWTLVHAEALLEKNDSRLTAKGYLNIFGDVLINENFTYDFGQCYTHDRPLYSSRRFSLPRISTSIYFVVVSVDFYIQPHIQANLDLRNEACIYSNALEARAALVPSVTFTIEGGASISLLVVKGGISLELSFTYEIEGSAEVRICKSCTSTAVYAQPCVAVYDSWPSNKIDFYAWYQLPSIKYCRDCIWGWCFKWPCGFGWGRKRRFDPLSITWNLSGRPREELYSNCDELSDPSCPV